MSKEWWEYRDLGENDLEPEEEKEMQIEKDFWEDLKSNEEREEK